MKHLLIAVALLLGLVACTPAPQPIYDADSYEGGKAYPLVASATVGSAIDTAPVREGNFFECIFRPGQYYKEGHVILCDEGTWVHNVNPPEPPGGCDTLSDWWDGCGPPPPPPPPPPGCKTDCGPEPEPETGANPGNNKPVGKATENPTGEDKHWSPSGTDSSPSGSTGASKTSKEGDKGPHTGGDPQNAKEKKGNGKP